MLVVQHIIPWCLTFPGWRGCCIEINDIFIQHGNPFEDDGPELIVLDTRDCADQAVVDTVHHMQNLGTKQYQQFVSEVFVNQSKSIHDTVKRNSATASFKAESKIQNIATAYCTE